jgi:small GTP-binding protein
MTETSVDANFSVIRQKIIFCGDAGVGKTSIIISLMGQKFSEEYEPSIGVDFFSKTIRYKERMLKLQIWDSAGQEKFRSLIPNYIRGSSLIFLIFDITNKTSYDNIPEWIKFITDIDNNGNIILVGNKIDLKEKRVVNKEEAEKFSQEKKYEYFEVSAKEGTNIDNMIYKSISGLPIFKKINGELYDKDIIFKDLVKENMDSFRFQKNDVLNNTGNNIMNTDPGNMSNFTDLNNNYGVNKNGLLQNKTKKKRKCLC